MISSERIPLNKSNNVGKSWENKLELCHFQKSDVVKRIRKAEEVFELCFSMLQNIYSQWSTSLVRKKITA